MSNRPITVLRVLCDTRKLRRIAIVCRCAHRWLEIVPGELHDSKLIAEFDCPKCGQVYQLRDKTLQRVKEDTDDRQNTVTQQTNRARGDKRNYDA
jgi:predicted RNA-binding Zn-ribbon protein involved in translation (DUF1610 family)